MSSNKQIAEILEEIADLLEVMNVQWKPRAYRMASVSIESLSESIEDLYKQGGIKKIMEIPGIGEHIAQKIEEIIKTGKSLYLSKLKKEMPVDVENLKQIEGMGPKTIALVYKHLNVKTVDDLKNAAKEGKIEQIKGLGPKTQDAILHSAGQRAKIEGRMLLPQADSIAQQVINEIKIYCKQIDVCGSLRRGKETIGDIDLLATSKNGNELMKTFTSMRMVHKIVMKGDTRSTVLLNDGVQIDLRVVDEDSYGAATQYFIGNKQHNIATRTIAKKKGYKLSEYGLFRTKDNKKIAASDEKEIYSKLGLQYISPEMREMIGEIEAAQKNKIPNLVELKDIQGDLHSHTIASDGGNTILEMAKAAQKLGLKYLLISEHTNILKIAGGLSERQLLDHFKEIDRINKKLDGITLLKGMEANILHNGIDIGRTVLKEADVVVASIHGGMKGSKEEMTGRIIIAMENEFVNIIGHPTGRNMPKRFGYELDFEKIFDVAKRTKTALEINSQPKRLDLRDIHVKAAIEAGVKLVISTDSHSVEQLQNMKYGVMTARRGWATKKDILNTLDLKKFMEWFD